MEFTTRAEGDCKSCVIAISFEQGAPFLAKDLTDCTSCQVKRTPERIRAEALVLDQRSSQLSEQVAESMGLLSGVPRYVDLS